jgi:hypothetical protein
MGGVFSSTQEKKLISLNTNNNDKVVCLKEVEQLNNTIEKMIIQCSEEKSLIKSKYGMDPSSVSVASCTAVFKYYGNHAQTFNLLKSRFKDKTTVFELGTKYYPEDDDDWSNYTGSVWFYERSVIKIVV